MNNNPKEIAIVTGATGGIGKAFVSILQSEVDEVWAIGRNTQKLKVMQSEWGSKIVPIQIDLGEIGGVEQLVDRLQQEKPIIKYLVNNAGMGKMGRYDAFEIEEINATVDINCKVVVTLSTISIPYMKRGSMLLNISSQASFQPNPYLNLYAASKAFVTSYSRALHRELKEKGITVTAVCPGWVNTEMLAKEVNGKPIKFPGMVEVEPVVQKALKDAKKGRDLSVYGAYVKSMQLFSKVLPHGFIMTKWLKGIKQFM